MLAVISAAFLAPLANPQPALASTTFEQKMLDLINQRRAAAGVGPVQASLVLNTIAGPGPYLGCGLPLGGRASDMGARNYFSHTILNCGTQSVFNILTSTAGLVYSGAAENIAWMNGTTDPLIAAERLTNDLMGSPGHRANILDPKFTHVGLGSWRSPAGQSWSGGGYPLQNVWITAQVFAQMPLAAAPAVNVSPASLGFGERVVSTTGPAQAVTVKNSGSGTLNISGTSLTGANAGDFSIVSNNCGASVAAGASCSISVAFRPGATGARAATLSVSDNAAGSPHTVALSGTGTAASLTAPPTSVVATGGDGTLSVSWAAPSSGPAPVGYGVFIYDAVGYTDKGAWVCGTCTTAVITGLANGGQFFAGVYGHNGTTWGAGAASNATWVLAVPGSPGNVRPVPGNGAMTVTWDVPTTPGSEIDGYGVFVYDAKGYTGKYAWVCAKCTTATIPGLTNGVSYYALAYAHNANGWGVASTTASVIVGAPGAPGSVVASKANGNLTVTWTGAQPGAAPMSGYGGWVYDASGFTGKTFWVCATCTTGTVSGLTVGKEYTVQVHGYNEFGWGVAGSSPRTTL